MTSSTKNPTPDPDTVRAVLFAVVGLCFVLAADRVPGQSSDQDDAASELLIAVEPSGLEISGPISSSANENILRATAARLFADQRPTIELAVQPGLPPGWALVTDLTLQAMSQTRSATATVRAYRVAIRGFTADRQAWMRRAARIRNQLPAGWAIESQVEETVVSGVINRQCIEVFRTAVRGRPIKFTRASAEIGTAAMPLLDELIQIAVDCPGSRIDITGHTDATGEEAANLALSQQRADAVASYLTTGGIAEARVTASGVGSSRPLVDEETAQARQLNRRIELALTFPAED